MSACQWFIRFWGAAWAGPSAAQHLAQYPGTAPTMLESNERFPSVSHQAITWSMQLLNFFLHPLHQLYYILFRLFLGLGKRRDSDFKKRVCQINLCGQNQNQKSFIGQVCVHLHGIWVFFILTVPVHKNRHNTYVQRQQNWTNNYYSFKYVCVYFIFL